MRIFSRTIVATAAACISACIPASVTATESGTVLARVKGPHHVAMSFDVDASDIVYDTPEGSECIKSKSGEYYSSGMWGIMKGTADGIPCRVVETETALWIYNPYTGLNTETWIKGDIEGDKAVFRFPQAVYTDSDGENEYVYVAQMCYFNWLDDTHEEGLYYPFEGETEMVFAKEEGKWVMQPGEEVNEHPVIMGLVTADDGIWCSFSEWDTSLEDFSAEAVEVPEGIKAEQWSFLAYNREDSAYTGGKLVNVGIDGNDIYIQGLADVLPESWVKGTIDGGKVTVKSGQYLGMDEMANLFGFFYGAVDEEKYNEEWDYYYYETTLTDELTFGYDPEAGVLETDGNMVINKGSDKLNIYDSYVAPKMKVQGEVSNFVPAAPIPGYYVPMGDYVGVLYFTFPNLNTEGQVLDTANLYYRVYVDGDLMTFYNDEYEGLPEATEEIPFSFTNYNTISYYGTFNLTHFFNIMFDGYDSLAIQTIYKNGDDVYESDIVSVVGGSGIANPGQETAPVAVGWFDISGRKVSNPGTGIYIRRSVYADGNVRSEKVVL